MRRNWGLDQLRKTGSVAILCTFLGLPALAQDAPLVKVQEPLPSAEDLVVPEEPLSDDSELAPPIAPEPEVILEGVRDARTPKVLPGVSASAVRQAVESWARDWQSRKTQAYFSWYSSEFRPAAGLSRQAWEEQRRRRVLAPAFIAVELEELQVHLSEDSGRARVEFVQRYRSNLYQDEVRKVLDLQHETGEWRILQEQSLQLDG